MLQETPFFHGRVSNWIKNAYRKKNKKAMMALDCSPESFSPQMNSPLFIPFVPTCDPQVGASFDPSE